MGDVGLRIANVAVARRIVLRFEFLAGDFVRAARTVWFSVNAAAGPDVEDFAGNVGSLAGQKIGLHGIVDEREIAGLLAIAKNHGLRLFQEARAEFRQDAGVGRAGILARTENIEVAERDIFEAIAAAERLRVKFADKFGDAVGRDGRGLHGFDFGQRRRLAVGRGGSGEDHALHFGIASGDENIESAIDIDA